MRLARAKTGTTRNGGRNQEATGQGLTRSGLRVGRRSGSVALVLALTLGPAAGLLAPARPAAALAERGADVTLAAAAPAAAAPAAGAPASADAWLARARAAGVAADAAENLRTEALSAGLSPAQVQALGERVARVAEQRLPWQPVLDRARQGLAKGAPFERIDAVCAGLEARLHEGAALVDKAFPGTDVKRPIGGRSELIDHTTFALEKGVQPTALTSMFTTLDGAPTPASAAATVTVYTAPVVALTSLSAEGVPAGDGVALVTQAWQSGVRDGDLENLGLTLSQALRNGQPASLVNDTCDRFRRREAVQQILGDLRNRFGGPPHDGRLGPGGPGPNGGLPPRPGQPGGGPGPIRPGLGGGHSGDSGPGGSSGPGGNDGGRPRPPRRPGGGSGGTGGGGGGGTGGH